MSLSTLEQAAVADIKKKYASLSAEAKDEVAVVESWAGKNWEIVALVAFILGIVAKIVF